MSRLILACICLISRICTQCSRSEDRAHRDASTVTVFWPGDEWLLGPDWDEWPQFLMFENLSNLYESYGMPMASLAERWERSEDCRTWTFYLRRDVRWHDGVPMTAHDVKFNLELFAHPDVLAHNTNNLWFYMESVTVLDDFTFTITYKRPRCDDFPHDNWNIFYPKHL